MTDLGEFVAGGYFLLKSVPRQMWLSADLLPEDILSLSECISPSVQIYWGWHENGQAEARQFGVPEERLADLREWLTLGERVHFSNVFYSVSAAQEFVAEFLPAVEHLHLLGIALPRGLVDAFLQTNKQTVYNSTDGKYEEAEYGINEILRKGEPLSPYGHVLGFEVLSYNYHLGHSWLCNYLERKMHTLYGIRPNSRGFIDTLEEAMQVYEWIAEDEQKGQRAEPEPYYPWLVVEYPVIFQK
jgi:hypothetical protein